MRFTDNRALRIAAFALALVACNADRVAGPSPIMLAPDLGATRFVAPLDPAGVRISEFHYDNPGTDSGEAIEISAPVGTDLTGWSIVRYNGGSTAASAAAATVYTTPAATSSLTGLVVAPPTACGSRGVMVVSYAQDGLQNGAPDGFALVNPANEVVEFLSYEGPMTAGSGVAAGMTATDVGIPETGATIDATSSIQRVYNATTGTFSWQKLPRTFGSCNDDNSGGVTPPAAEVASVTVTPANATITAGGTQQYTATAYDAQHNPIPNTSFTWGATPASVATVNATGLATAIAAGDAKIAATAGSKSDTGTLHVNPVVVVPMPDIRFSELHYDNAGTDVGERIEVEGPSGASLDGWSIVLYDGGTFNGVTGGSYATQSLTGLSLSTGSCNARGVVTIDFAQIQNGSPDGMALVDATGHVVELLSYEGTFAAGNGPALGMTSTDILASESGSGPATGSLRRSATNTWTVETANNFGSVNACGGPVLNPPPSKSITFSGRDPVNDAPLPVGFESQLFASEVIDGVTSSPTITWVSLTPSIATIDDKGVFHGVSAGTASFKATAPDGTSATRDMPIVVGERSTTDYVGNTLFGEPKDADASDDFIIRRPEYTTSFNKNRSTPNWVSYRVDLTYHPSGIDRCNCFTFDPELVAAGFPRITTGDYTGAGAFAGYGIDRGHLARSFDRTAGSLDNADTYYFANIIPQAADLNQGPWKILEDNLGDSAYIGNRSVYVIAGAYGNKGTVKGEGRIVMPTSVWKVAVVMPHEKTLADIHSPSDMTVIAVIMPNDPGVKSVPWQTYTTTVAEIERQSGYDVLAALPDNIECAVEHNNCAPTAAVTGQPTGVEGSTLTFNASGSTDPDGDALTYAWTFGDGGTATGINPSHTFNVDQGSYAVTVSVSDGHAHTSQATMTVSISNAKPTAAFSQVAPLVEGSSFTLSLDGGTDPSPADAASLTYAFDCGDGAGYHATAATPSLACATTDDGARHARAKVIDKDGAFSEYLQDVQVANAAPVITSFTTPAVPTSTGAQVTATVAFTDVGSADTHTALIAWGDGTTSAAAVAAGQASATHAYATTDFYTITVTVTDDDGGSATRASSVLVVYDAGAGFVTGGGYVRDGGRGGDKTHFTLDARYAGGGTPSGRFDLRTSDGLAVQASAFSYLVVKGAGATATVRGTGTLADGTAVEVLVSVRDGKLAGDRIDRVRIKVWNSSTSAVLFDTQAGVAELAAPATIVDGGNITIHR
jgi:DNA/RNA endonuclease G (NUC1)/PKD repeat protein